MVGGVVCDFIWWLGGTAAHTPLHNTGHSPFTNNMAPSSSKRKTGSTTTHRNPKKSKVQKAGSRVESKKRVVDDVNFPRKKKEGKALVWSFFDEGFTVYKNQNDPELNKLVVCETCVANDLTRDAEFTFWWKHHECGAAH